jgi:hypothetical protein
MSTPEKKYQNPIPESKEALGLSFRITADPTLVAAIRLEIRRMLQIMNRDKLKLPGCYCADKVAAMVKELRNIGYTFVGDDYQVASVIMKMYDHDRDGCVAACEFSDWFRSQVISRPENLRTFLYSSLWVQAVITRLYEAADSSKCGFVSGASLRNSVHEMYKAVKEPAPEDQELKEVLSRIMSADDILEHCQLSLSEFRMALLELMVQMYYLHFNESMTIGIQHNLNASKHPVLPPANPATGWLPSHA